MLGGASFASVARGPAAGGGGWANDYAINFGGTNEYATFGQPSDLNLTPNAAELTINCWAKTSGDGTIICKARNAARQFQLYLSGGAISAYCGGNFLAGGSGYSDGTWRMFTYRLWNNAGTYTCELYQAGAFVSGASNTAGSTTNVVDWLIGARRDADNTDHAFLLTGLVDEVTIWDVALSAAEITALYNSGTTFDPSTHSQAANLIHYFRMGDGDTYPTLIDGPGTADATMTNMESGDIDTDEAP